MAKRNETTPPPEPYVVRVKGRSLYVVDSANGGLIMAGPFALDTEGRWACQERADQLNSTLVQGG